MAHRDWSNQYVRLLHGAPTRCPGCSAAGLRINYFGDGPGKLGWGLLWCPNCKRAAKLSRIQIPASATVAKIDDPLPDEMKELRLVE